jgi:hypothetical protein
VQSPRDDVDRALVTSRCQVERDFGGVKLKNAKIFGGCQEEGDGREGMGVILIGIRVVRGAARP